MAIVLEASAFAAMGRIQAEPLEAAVWHEVCDLLKNPEKLERELKEGGEADASLQNAEAFKALPSQTATHVGAANR